MSSINTSPTVIRLGAVSHGHWMVVSLWSSGENHVYLQHYKITNHITGSTCLESSEYYSSEAKAVQAFIQAIVAGSKTLEEAYG